MFLWGNWNTNGKKQRLVPSAFNVNIFDFKAGYKNKKEIHEKYMEEKNEDIGIIDFVRVENEHSRVSFMLGSNMRLYAFGKSSVGLLGLGECENTKGVAMPVLIPYDEQVLSIEVGNEHAIALTNCGKVYSWGSNGEGQVGVSYSKGMSSKKRISLTMTTKIETPVQVFPTEEDELKA